MSMDNRDFPGRIDRETGEYFMSPPGFRTGYQEDSLAISDSFGLACPEPSMTQQQFREDADINVLMARFNLTGKFPENPRMPEYGDFTGLSDYRAAVEAVRDAEARFMAFPATFRERFHHDPGQFEAFVLDPANRSEMEELGLIKRPEPPPTPASAVPPQAPKEPPPVA